MSFQFKVSRTSINKLLKSNIVTKEIHIKKTNRQYVDVHGAASQVNTRHCGHGRGSVTPPSREAGS